MARIEVRATLTNAAFPFYSPELAGTVLVSQDNQELNRIPIRSFDGTGAEQSYGIPQAFYMQNVFPTTRGYNSVSFSQLLRPHPWEDTWLLKDYFDPIWVDPVDETYLLTKPTVGSTGFPEVDEIFVLQETTATTKQVALYSSARGEDLVYTADHEGWNKFASNPEFDGLVTVAHVQGRSYICYEGIGIYRYNFDDNTFDPVTVTGLDMSSITGICAGGLYLVAWDNKTVYWSSATDAVDFTPSLISGAGSSSLLGARGSLVVLLPLADGFCAYTDKNAVGATYSGSDTSPWTFREIPGSAGVLSPKHASFESNFDYHIAWTTSGFQKISFRQADPIWAELSDLIARGVVSFLDRATDQIVTRIYDLPDVKVSSVGARYTIVSLRESNTRREYQHAFMYDWALARWGRMEVPHMDFFDLRIPTLGATVSYQDLLDAETTYEDLLIGRIKYTDWMPESLQQGLGENFGMVQKNGGIYAVMSYLDSNSAPVSDTSAKAEPSVLFLGNFKRTRGRDLVLQEARADTHLEGNLLAHVVDMGGDIVASKEMTPAGNSLAGYYYSRVYANSLAMSVRGRFNLTNLQLTFSTGGTRSSPRR